MSTLTSKVESLLLISGKPLPVATILKTLQCTHEQLHEAIALLEQRYNAADSGIHVMTNDNRLQLITNPAHRDLIQEFIKDETTGELTRASLETLTIIAYRQPVTKEEMEQIRGVNCSLILRNLLIRGLIEPHEERGGLATTYAVTNDFLRFLGVHKVEELPEYARLHSNESVAAILERAKNDQPS